MQWNVKKGFKSGFICSAELFFYFFFFWFSNSSFFCLFFLAVLFYFLFFFFCCYFFCIWNHIWRKKMVLVCLVAAGATTLLWELKRLIAVKRVIVQSANKLRICAKKKNRRKLFLFDINDTQQQGRQNGKLRRKYFFFGKCVFLPLNPPYTTWCGCGDDENRCRFFSPFGLSVWI